MKEVSVKGCTLILLTIIAPLNATPTDYTSWLYNSLANIFSSATKNVKKEHVAIGVGTAAGLYGLYYAWNRYNSCPEAAMWQKFPFKWGCYTRQADPKYMQDYHAAKTEGNVAFFGIFDGHGGDYGHLVADATANGDSATGILSLWDLVSQGLRSKGSSKEDTLTKAFESMDNQFPDYTEADAGEIIEDPKDRRKYNYAGTTATVALLEQPSENRPGSIDLAWVGDSRAILINDNGDIVETKDHKPSDDKEKKRIESTGGDVSYSQRSGWRVNRSLGITRSIGDKNIKAKGPGIIATPYVIHKNSYNGYRWLVIASDGVWDHLTNEEVSNIIKDQKINIQDNSYACFKKDLLEEASSSSSKPITKVSTTEGFTSMINVAKRLVDIAYNESKKAGREKSDNISALVLRFNE